MFITDRRVKENLQQGPKSEVHNVHESLGWPGQPLHPLCRQLVWLLPEAILESIEVDIWVVVLQDSQDKGDRLLYALPSLAREVLDHFPLESSVHLGELGRPGGQLGYVAITGSLHLDPNFGKHLLEDVEGCDEFLLGG